MFIRFLTHAHIDHIGRLPELIRNGFKGEIICSHPTKALLIPMLGDAMKFSDIPVEDVRGIEKTIDDLSWGFEYGKPFDLQKGISLLVHGEGSARSTLKDVLEKRGYTVQ